MGGVLPRINPLRISAAGCPIYLVPILLQIDDLSGNKSKKWNIHYAANFVNASLCCKMMQSERSIKLFSILQHTEPLEIMEAMSQQFM
jgi:hypothetical protein